MIVMYLRDRALHALSTEEGLPLRTVWQASVAMPLAAAGVLLLSLLFGGPATAASALAEFTALMICCGMAAAQWCMCDVWGPLVAVGHDLQRIAALDLQEMETEKSGLSPIVEVRDLQAGLVGVVSGLRVCKPYFPDDVVRTLEKSGAALGQSVTETIEDGDNVSDDFTDEGAPQPLHVPPLKSLSPLARQRSNFESVQLPPAVRMRQGSMTSKLSHLKIDQKSQDGGDDPRPDSPRAILQRLPAPAALVLDGSDSAQSENVSPALLPLPTAPDEDAVPVLSQGVHTTFGEAPKLQAAGRVGVITRRVHRTSQPPGVGPKGTPSDPPMLAPERQGSMSSLCLWPTSLSLAKTAGGESASATPLDGVLSPIHRLERLRDSALSTFTSPPLQPAAGDARKRAVSDAPSLPPVLQQRDSAGVLTSPVRQLSDGAPQLSPAGKAGHQGRGKRVHVDIVSPKKAEKDKGGNAGSTVAKTPRFNRRASFSFGGARLVPSAMVSSGAHTPSLFSSLNLSMRAKRGTVLSAVFDVVEVAQHDPSGTYEVCNSIVCVVLDIVKEQYGKVCEFGADKVLCSWNTHSPCTRHALAACRAAREIRKAVTAEASPNASFGSVPAQESDAESNGKDVASSLSSPPSIPQAFGGHDDTGGMWSIALTTGNVFCGNVGNNAQRSPFVFGQALDQAQMLNRLSLQINAPVLLAETTKAVLNDENLKLRPLDMVDWGVLDGGGGQREAVYELLSEHSQLNLERWKEAFHAVLSSDYVAAHDLFSRIEAVHDPQLRRLLNVTKNAGATLPAPYARSLKFWSRFTGEVKTGAASQDKEVGRVPPPGRRMKQRRQAQSVLVAQNEEAMRGKRRGREQQGSHLRTAIEEAQRLRGASPSSSSSCSSETSDPFSTPSTARADCQPPKTFTDSSGSVWLRSNRMIGSGAFGDVWLGMSAEGGLVAFKCVKVPARMAPARTFLGMRQDAAAGEIASIINEVEMLSQYRHESIVSFIGCGVYEKFVVITMEYVSGGSLASVIDQFGQLPVATARRYTKEVITGLQYLHSHNIVHRDLKPANVLLHTDGCCKLSDFGTCVSLSSVSGRQVAEGTPLFMAPESSRGAFCKASDLWSLGLTVIQMLNGMTPFAWDEGVSELTGVMFSRWLCKEDGDVPLPHPDDLGEDGYNFIRKVMVRDPGARPTTDTLVFDVFVM
eukprot:TRINITY_DN15704_c0_g1_i1.p1 TRINITY_DN15704_c0_g1~~TRINITY_DN15704_c0_g1_i1.p1  ORF type:complete len:1188 (+),score=282.68 TRINITY_DN15704_c0_g1_i1:79-3642(+)